MKITWSPLSFEKLEGIYEFIAKDDSVAAKKLIKKMLLKVESLSKYPERGRKVPEINRDDIREIFEGEYRIIYKIKPKKIAILTIRNFKQLLPKKEIK